MIYAEIGLLFVILVIIIGTVIASLQKPVDLSDQADIPEEAWDQWPEADDLGEVFGEDKDD